jgi:hypothetical protein
MYLFKAKQAAASELERACQEHGVTIDQVRSVLASEPRLASALFKAPHRYAGTAADVVAHVAPWITHSAAERLQQRLGSLAEKSGALIRSSPERAVELAQGVASAVPTFARRAREDAVLIWERRRSRGQDAAMNSAAQ